MSTSTFTQLSLKVVEFVQSCFTFTGLRRLSWGAQDVLLDFYTAPELDSVADDADDVVLHVLGCQLTH